MGEIQSLFAIDGELEGCGSGLWLSGGSDPIGVTLELLTVWVSDSGVSNPHPSYF